MQKATTTIAGPCNFFFCIHCLLCLLNDGNRYYGCSEGTERSSGGATTTTMGPNDARRVVWALGEFFLIFFVFFWYLTIYIATTDSLKVWCGSTQAKTTTTGPNDARRVVWA